MNNMMGPFIGQMMTYWVVLSVLVLVVLGLLAVWLFQQVKRGATDTGAGLLAGLPVGKRSLASF